ncbi:nucleotide exchange factor GrpE [Thermoactinomyces sp. Gus2-1]|jgi:molecular chaperone GrpE|uniref:nucleotide exchange factor GrpE n=1 Tax=Thermoactinomyces sp. Gus2-1 TaxID=1535750 RepID=UPI000503F15E|nr:nucleotide exchange factor GrpE [Thermoactinomyces sp. Gus2-1]KFZ40797.1 hypothetical protein JS81_05125 [Thermoactinomyces sp. Gus2-1]
MNQEKDELQHQPEEARLEQEQNREEKELHIQKEPPKEETVSEEEKDGGKVLEKLEAELEGARQSADHWKKQAEENKELYLRALADYENYRRRARKEKEEALKYSVVPFLENLLPVLDNFERALDAADANQDVQALQEGIEMVYRQFLNVLSQAGLTLIETEGKPFNPHEHNAVMQVEADDVESGMVVEELQPGYRYLDRVIRPSIVKVSK